LKVCVIGSPLVRWRIGVNIVPPGDALPTSFVDNGSMIAYVVEVVGTTEAEFVVPYLHQYPWRSTGFVATTDTSTAWTRAVYFSLTPAQCPSPTPVYPKVCVYLKGGPLFQLAVPSLDNYVDFSFQPYPAAPSFAGGALITEGRSVETFGEVVEDLVLLSKRSSHNGTFLYTTAGHARSFVYPCDGVQKVPDGTVVGAGSNLLTMYNSKLTFFQLVRGPFMGYSGGSCLKVAFSELGSATQPALLVLPYIATWDDTLTMGVSYVGFDYTSNGATTFLTSSSPLLEISNPDRCLVHFKNPITYSSNLVTLPPTTTSYLVWSMHPTPEQEGLYSYEAFLSARDDFMVGGFLCCPTIYRLAT